MAELIARLGEIPRKFGMAARGALARQRVASLPWSAPGACWKITTEEAAAVWHHGVTGCVCVGRGRGPITLSAMAVGGVLAASRRACVAGEVRDDKDGGNW